MSTQTKSPTLSDFSLHVKEGLSAQQKYLSSRYMYNEKGDKLFQQIMSLPEYYLTRAEHDILAHQKNEIAEAFVGDGSPFLLIELGAGDGTKTRLLLKELLDKEADFTYMPVDISGSVLKELKSNLQNELPHLDVQTINQEYFAALKFLNEHKAQRKVVLFLGSNIGNLSNSEARSFMNKAQDCCENGDLWFLGIDLKKDPDIIRKAYNDAQGVTADFNLNLLHRMNDELEADFNLTHWKHYESYDPLSGEARSYLVSKVNQKVRLKEIDLEVNFEQGEPIHTEISKKYHLSEIETLAKDTGYTVVKNFIDNNGYFVDTIWRAKE